MLGPIAVAAGWVLWIVSVTKAPRVVWRASKEHSLPGRVVRVALAILCCTVGAPLWLLVLWVKGGLSAAKGLLQLLRNMARRCYPERAAGTAGRTNACETPPGTGTDLNDYDEHVVVTMLKAAPAGERELFDNVL